MQVLEAIRTIGRILMDGARALFAHWPVLLTIFFLGKAASAGLLWLAVMASKYSPVAGMLLLPGAPIAMLVAIILMLRAVIPSVPELADTFSPRSGVAWWRSEMTLVVQVLVPFLAVYASQGWMKEDLRTYMYYATADEWMSEGFAADFTRVSFGTEAQIFAIVMIAMVLRKVIAGFELGKRHLPVACIAVGATIYGDSLPAAKPLLTSEEMTKRIKQIPNPIRRATSQVFEPVVGPCATPFGPSAKLRSRGSFPWCSCA